MAKLHRGAFLSMADGYPLAAATFAASGPVRKFRNEAAASLFGDFAAMAKASALAVMLACLPATLFGGNGKIPYFPLNAGGRAWVIQVPCTMNRPLPPANWP